MSGTTAMQPPKTRTAWSRFPVWLIVAMGFVFVVNARFIMVAFQTFPGAASSADFDTSNSYNRILSSVESQNALGWHVRADTAGAMPVIVLSGKDGAPMTTATVEGMARRPVDNEPDVAVTFTQTGPGHFILATPLRQGQWDLLLRIAQGEQQMRVTRRVLVR